MKWFKKAKLCILISSFIAFVVCTVNIKIIHNAYQLICILPLLYLITISLLFLTVKNTRITIIVTLYFYIGITFIRFVITPMLGSITGYFATLGSHVTEASARKTIFLLSWELVASTLFILFVIIIFGSKTEKPLKYKQISLRGSPILYMGFILVSAMLYITFGKNTFEFLFIEALRERKYSFTDNSVVISAIITYGLDFLIILIIYFFYKKYKKNKKKKHMVYSLVVSMLRLTLISSEGRMAIVYLMIAYLWILPMLFPEHKKIISRWISIATIVVVGLLSIYKVFYVFLYDSYAMAISMSNFGLAELTEQLDIYLYGIKTVARNVSFCDLNSVSILNFPFDLLRNTFGFHYLFRGSNMKTTSELYNLYIYSGRKDSGNLFSGISYGYMYFSFILAPLSICFNILLACSVERWLRKQRYIERIFIGDTIYARLLLQLFSHFPFNWNIVSRTIVLGVIVIESAAILSNRSNLNTRSYLKLSRYQ